MKKEIFVFLAFIFVFFSFSPAFAQEISTTSLTPVQETTQISQQQVQAVSKQAAAGLNQGVEDVFQREISIPASFEAPIKLIFGIESPILIKNLIMVIGVWLIIFIFVFDILSIFAEQYNVVRAVLAFLITSLMSMTGSFQPLADFFYHLTDFIPYISGNSIIKTILAIIISVILLFLFLTSKRILFAKEKKTEARISGMKIGAAVKTSEELIKPPKR